MYPCITIIRPRGFVAGGEGRRAAAAAPEGDAGGDLRGQPVAHHVERATGRGSDASAGRAHHRRHGEQPHSHPHRDAGHLRLAARTGDEKAGTGVSLKVRPGAQVILLAFIPA